MKKLLVILLLFFLVSCTKSTLAVKESLFDIPSMELEICTVDCETDASLIDSYFDQFWTNISTLQDQLAPNRHSDKMTFVSGEYYSRDEIVHDDPITQHTVIDLEVPYERLNENMELAQAIHQGCTIGEVECVLSTENWSVNLFELKFGFTSSGGFFSAYFDPISGGNSYNLSFSFEFMNQGSVSFETQFYFSSEIFLLENMSQGIYRLFRYQLDDSIEVRYVDVNSYETFDYYLNGDEVLFYYYDANGGFLYYYFPAFYSFSVTKYTDMEYVAGLGLRDESYSCSINFYMMDGWDQVQYLGLLPAYLYLDETRVYTDYSIGLSLRMPGYPLITGSFSLDETELSTYDFPKAFEGDVKFSELVQKLNEFKNLEDAVEITGITSTQIRDFRSEVLSRIDFS